MKTSAICKSIPRLAGIALSLTLVGAGCLPTSSSGGLDGGVFRTRNAGADWMQLRTLIATGKLGSIADVGTVSMAADPEDPLAFYVGTAENGLLTSLDGGESWMTAKGLGIGRVNAIAVDPKDKCTVFAARANQIMKTDNCGRDWNQVFFDARTDKAFTALVVDWFNPQIVYAATSEGDLYRSDDGGRAWRVSQRLEGTRIGSLAMDPRDSRVIYAATNGAGILKTSDGGESWIKIIQPFQDFDYARRPTRVAVDPNVAGAVYNISRYGILKSEDGGATWKPLSLPTPPGTVDIRAFLIHPKNSKILVYATDTAIVWSTDGGATWTPKKVPTGRGVSSLLYDSSSNPALYLGAAAKQ